MHHRIEGVHLRFFASAFTYGLPEYPLSDIPFQTIVNRAAEGIYRAKKLWTSSFIPEGTNEQWEWFNELQRISTSPENAARLEEEWGKIDIREILPQVRVPTIVFHCERDRVVPFEDGRRMAAAISGARFVPLPSGNHLVLADEPAWKLFVEEVGGFLGW